MKKMSIRSMIIPANGNLLVAGDLSQAESWIVGYSANEQNMIHSLNNSDIHTDSAAALFYPDNYCTHSWNKTGDDSICQLCQLLIEKPARYIGKRYNHASSYRMKYPRAAQVINKDSDKPPYITVTLNESKSFSENWHRRYHIKLWWQEIEDQLGKDRTITTTYGRSRTFFGHWGEELFKEATAYIPQSSVADHFNGRIHPIVGHIGGLKSIKERVIDPYQDRKLIHQGHYSFMAEIPIIDASDFAKEAKWLLLRPIVINDVQFTIPVDTEIGERWGELEKVA